VGGEIYYSQPLLKIQELSVDLKDSWTVSFGPRISSIFYLMVSFAKLG